MHRDRNCKLCALHETARTVCMLGKGPKRADIMVIGEAPGKLEDEKGVPFVGKSGQMLYRIIEGVGLDYEDMYITNAVNCRPPDNRTPKKKEIEACQKWLKYQISIVKPKYIITLGNVPLMALLGLKGVRKLRGKPITMKDGTIVMPTFHPSYALHDPRQEAVIWRDFREFKEIIEFGGIPEERALKMTIVDTWAKVDTMIAAMKGTISADIETTCLYPWSKFSAKYKTVNAKVTTVGVGTKSGEFIVPMNHHESPWDVADQKKIVKRITKAMEECIVVFQGGKFDILWMKVHYGVTWTNDFDLMLGHYLCDENDLHDLEHLAVKYLGAHKWDIPLSEKQGKAPLTKVAKYHAHDLYYTLKLHPKIKSMLERDPQVMRVFRKIMMPCSNLFAEMEERGSYIDLSKMDEAETYLRGEMAAAEKGLLKWGKINWGSPKQVGELLYGKLKIKCPQKTPKGGNSTSESTLNQIDHPCVADLLKFRGAKQQLSFFIEGWKPYIVDGRIHPSFKLHGTVTGRLSCEHPNFQQVPRDKRIRSLIGAPKGWTLLEADLSQIELRIVAELSAEPNMRKAFREGVDIHWLTALREIERGAGLKDLVIKTARSAMKVKEFAKKYSDLSPKDYGDAIQVLLGVGPDVAAQIDEEWKEYRKKAKAVNFGYVFGMWWKKFKIYARDNYGVHLTDQQAQESRIAFFEMYQLESWHKSQQRFARAHGYVRSLSGRKRRLPEARSPDDTPQRAEALRQSINSPVQSFANELNLMTLLQLREEFPREVMQPTTTVHDSVLIEVRNDYVERVYKRIMEIMRGPKLLKAFEIDLEVPIEGEAKLGPWGSSVSLDKWMKDHAKEAA